MLGLGKQAVEKLTYWVPTASKFGAAAGVGVLYFTDWKVVLQFVPFYNGKFTE